LSISCVFRYQRLTANYEKTANQLREEQIQLPETVDELQFECLRLREALIESRASKEHADEEYASEVEILNTELAQAQLLYRSLPQHSERRHSPENNELRQTIADLEKRLVESQNESIALSRLLEEYRQKCSQLQNELNTSEIVQKDFVKLSQQLQVQLEVIRQGDQELRWQFPDDIKKCNGCNVDLKHKVNCKHCGKVFCNKCTESVIQVGTNKANVCRVCETLLSRNSAPFFSSK
jgi:Rab GTPase-binding effector protein 1